MEVSVFVRERVVGEKILNDCNDWRLAKSLLYLFQDICGFNSSIIIRQPSRGGEREPEESLQLIHCIYRVCDPAIMLTLRVYQHWNAHSHLLNSLIHQFQIREGSLLARSSKSELIPSAN